MYKGLQCLYLRLMLWVISTFKQFLNLVGLGVTHISVHLLGHKSGYWKGDLITSDSNHGNKSLLSHSRDHDQNCVVQFLNCLWHGQNQQRRWKMHPVNFMSCRLVHLVPEGHLAPLVGAMLQNELVQHQHLTCSEKLISSIAEASTEWNRGFIDIWKMFLH